MQNTSCPDLQVMRDYREKRAEVEAAISRIRSHLVPAAGSAELGSALPGKEDCDKSDLWVDGYM